MVQTTGMGLAGVLYQCSTLSSTTQLRAGEKERAGEDKSLSRRTVEAERGGQLRRYNSIYSTFDIQGDAYFS